MNKHSIIGRLGTDPVIHRTKDNLVIAKFDVATSEKWKDKQGNKQEKTDWHRVNAFGKLAEIIEKYVKKGDLIYVSGLSQTRKYDKNGIDTYTTEIKASEIEMLGSKQTAEPVNDGFDDDSTIPF